VFENEAMTGTFTQNPVFSKITFALLEDTGWYMPDYSLAQQLEWGRGLGCAFAKGSCGEWINDKQSRPGDTIYPFCERLKNRTPLKLKCTVDRFAVAICNLVEYSAALDNSYQYFSSLPDETIDAQKLKSYGGFVDLADFCPYNQEFIWTKNKAPVRGSQCRVPENNPDLDDNLALEKYGANSVCIDQEGSWTKTSGNVATTAVNWGSGCYEVNCSNSDPYLTIFINGHSYACRQEGDTIMVTENAGNSRYVGSLICPQKHSACWGVAGNVSIEQINPDLNSGVPCFAMRVVELCVLLLVACYFSF
jgi:leishmanolysin-like peptidase